MSRCVERAAAQSTNYVQRPEGATQPFRECCPGRGNMNSHQLCCSECDALSVFERDLRELVDQVSDLDTKAVALKQIDSICSRRTGIWRFIAHLVRDRDCQLARQRLLEGLKCWQAAIIFDFAMKFLRSKSDDGVETRLL